MGGGGNRNVRALGIALAVLGVAGLGMLAARRLKQRNQGFDYPPDRETETESGDEAGAGIDTGTRTVFRIVTVKAHPANVEKDWNEWASTIGRDESRQAKMTFAAAPGSQGTEVRGELTYTPKAGKIGDIAQRMTHKSPGQMLGQDLKRFKMTVETGEIVKSDASIHKHMHPARPVNRLGNANLIGEAR